MGCCARRFGGRWEGWLERGGGSQRTCEGIPVELKVEMGLLVSDEGTIDKKVTCWSGKKEEVVAGAIGCV